MRLLYNREEAEDQMTNPKKPKEVKFEVYGQEMLEKEVKQAGNSGRIYLPPDWVGKKVKIVRVD